MEAVRTLTDRWVLRQTSNLGGHFIMMRSMYSAVSGLKTHQTKMDVIGNNIANVNTVAFKESSVTSVSYTHLTLHPEQMQQPEPVELMLSR